MATRLIVVYVNGSQKAVDSATSTFDFLSVKVGASGLELKETGGHFDLSAKRLTNIADGTAAGHAATKGQLDTGLSAKLDVAQVGVTVATLVGGKVPVSQLPNAIMEYQGIYDAALNSPALANGGGNADTAIGDVYRVGVAGTRDFGAGAIELGVGDYVILNSSKIWEKADTTDAVKTVNGQIGDVVVAEYSAAQARADLLEDQITDGQLDKAPSSNAVFDALALKSNNGHVHVAANITDFASAAKAATIDNAINSGTTDKAPSQDSVFTALAGKAPTAHTHLAADITNFTTVAREATVADGISDGVTDIAPSQNAVFDALALKADDSIVVKTVNGKSPTAGAVVVDSDDVAEGSANLYHTAARAKAAAVADSIADGVTDVAPSQNAVFDALALKSDLSYVDTQLGLKVDKADSHQSRTNDNASAVAARKVVIIKSTGNIDLAQIVGYANERLAIVGPSPIASTEAGLVYDKHGEKVGGFSGLLTGKQYFLAADGGITDTAPSSSGDSVIQVGFAVSSTILSFEPRHIIDIG